MLPETYSSLLLTETNLCTWQRVPDDDYIQLSDLKQYLFYYQELAEGQIQNLLTLLFERICSIEEFSFLFRFSLYFNLISGPERIENPTDFDWIFILPEESFNYLLSLDNYFIDDYFGFFNYETLAYFLLQSQNLLTFLHCEMFEKFQTEWPLMQYCAQIKFINCIFISFFPLFRQKSIDINDLEKIFYIFSIFDDECPQSVLEDTNQLKEVCPQSVLEDVDQDIDSESESQEEDYYFCHTYRMLRYSMEAREKPELKPLIQEFLESLLEAQEINDFFSQIFNEYLSILILDLNNLINEEASEEESVEASEEESVEEGEEEVGENSLFWSDDEVINETNLIYDIDIMRISCFLDIAS